MRSERLAFFLAIGCATAATAASARADVPQAPEIRIRTLAGDDFDLARLRGRVVLVHFWATWCPPCIKEMPALESFYEKYRARGVQVLAMSEDRTRDLDDVRRMIGRMRGTYPVAMAHKAEINAFGDPQSLPVTYVVDAAGAVRAEMRPDKQPVTEENLERIVVPLLPDARR